MGLNERQLNTASRKAEYPCLTCLCPQETRHTVLISSQRFVMTIYHPDHGANAGVQHTTGFGADRHLPTVKPSSDDHLDPVDAYFECITTCSLDDGECVTLCTEILR